MKEGLIGQTDVGPGSHKDCRSEPMSYNRAHGLASSMHPIQFPPMASNPLSAYAARRSEPGRFLQPVENGGIRLLILENISQQAVAAFRTLGFHVDHYTRALSEDELVEKIPSYHAIGIRSKTKITSRVISAAPKVRCPVILSLPVVNCFFSCLPLAVSASVLTRST